MNKTTTSFPFFGILGLIFITLKLTDVIDWSWWWVLAPLWAPVVLAVVMMVAAFCIVLAFGKRGGI